MKIGIQTWGGDGDIRPFIALAGGLSKAGHQVTLVVSSLDRKDYSQFADLLGFHIIHTHSAASFDLQLFDTVSTRIVAARRMKKQVSIFWNDLLGPDIPVISAAAKDLCKGNDVVVGHHLLYPLRVWAEKNKIPDITVTLVHFSIPSRHAAPLGAPPLGAWLNPFWWWLARGFLNRIVKPDIDKFRLHQGLRACSDILTEMWISKYLNLIAVSPVFCQRQDDWGAHQYVCGFLELPEAEHSEQVPEAITAFLAANSPPVFITLGSLLPHDSANRLTVINILTEAVRLANCRAIIQVFAEDVSQLRSDQQIIYVSSIPHRNVFPKCFAVVHHGGAGTTQSATKAGCPSIVVAHIVEQIQWGTLLHRLGLGPSPLHRTALTAKKLAGHIHAVMDDPGMKKTAQLMGVQMQDTDGVATAVSIIEQRLNQ